MRYVATMNVPGYLPMDDEPPVFDTPGEAWDYLADRRRDSEDHAVEVASAVEDAPYSDTVHDLDTKATANHGVDTVYADTPGYDGTHDLGLAYSVSIAEEG